MTYQETKIQALKNPAIKYAEKDILRKLDDMDCVDALHILEDLTYLFTKKCNEALGVK